MAQLLYAGEEIGLSPLARGTLESITHEGLVTRFIPAGAGNTPTSSGVNDGGAVYPRWRGEHGVLWWSVLISDGLSPLARGTPTVDGREIRPERFIPAGAGNTPRAGRLL